MPWKLEKAENGYFVVDDKGKRYSKKPISKSRATRQMRALYANEAPAKKEHAPGLSIFKEANGDYRWITLSSTAFRDRDGEIVSTKALQDDCERADRTGEYGPLRWWHVPGVDIGQCDFNMVYGRTLIESGTFNTPEIAQAVAKEARNLQISIGFNHPKSQPDSAGVFHQIRRFERSLLPAGRAANLFTNLVVRKESNMKIGIPEKLKAFGALLNDDALVASILSQVQMAEKSADDKGVEFKEADETETAPAETEKAADKQIELELEPKDSEGEPVEAEDEEEGEEGEEEKAFDDGPFVGDLAPDEFGSLMANVITKAFEPVMTSIKELQEGETATKEARTKESAVIQKQIDALTTRLKELEGNTPKAAKGYVASGATDNLVEEGHRLKGASPQTDPLDKFAAFALGQPQ